MEVFQTRFFIFYLFLAGLISSSSCATTVIVDGVTQWKHPTIPIGDSIIFRHKHNYNLYIFRSRFAFNLCNFTQATLLTHPNSSSYTWRPSRLGNFYFSFNNGATDDSCQHGQKLAIKVVPKTTPTTAPPPQSPPPPAVAAPPPTPGGSAASSSSPSFPWPFLPHEKSAGSVSSEAPISTAMAPLLPDGMPFISSNPAVPLPASEVDSATIFPLPTSAINHAAKQVQMVGLLGLLIPQCIAIVIML